MSKSTSKNGPDLLVVESPTKTKTLKKFLGRGYKIMATKGHILDLPKSRLGVDLDHDFEPDYQVIQGKKSVIQAIAKEAKAAAKVYLAPDPDREGEAIAYHLKQQLTKANSRIYRVVYNELTKPAVLRGIQEARKIDDNLVMAQQARRILDRLVGYQVSPVLWKTVLRGLSAGRVQSVALKLICEREAEIEGFVPKEFWKIRARLQAKGKDQFLAALVKIGGEEFEVSNEKDAKQLCADIEKQTFAVKSVKSEEKKRNPLPPYITSTLQQDASVRLGYSPQKTMMVAQQLYEGVELGEAGSVGLISYMRTDSVRLSEEALTHIRGFIQNKYGQAYLPEQPQRYKSRKAAQDAHEAIRPTAIEYEPQAIKGYLTHDQFRLYNLIFSRSVASQMMPAVMEVTTAEIEAARYLFRASSSRVRFDGFLKVYEIGKDDANGNGEEEAPLPPLKEGDKLKLVELLPSQHFTKPPPRFSEASLVKELEQNGIGRPSTYAQIISTLKTRKYVDLEKRRLFPTDLGKTVNKILIEYFPKIFSVEFTAHMENELDKIEDGEDNWVDVLREFYAPLSKTLEKVNGKLHIIKRSTKEDSGETCEKCGSAMVIKWGRNGRFLACSAYPDCRNTRPLNGEGGTTELDRNCPKCGQKLVLRQGRFGRFVACSAYPDCDFTEAVSTGVACPQPKCGGQIVEKTTRRGKVFYGCSKYPKCDFALWDKPVAKTCPSCGNPYLLEKDTKKDGLHLKCPKCSLVERQATEEVAERLEDAVK